MSAIPLSELATSRRWQTNFLKILPVVQAHAKVRFRKLNETDKEEATTQAVAAACVGYATLVRQKKLGHVYPGNIATNAVRFVNAGRHVGGHQNGAGGGRIRELVHGTVLFLLPPCFRLAALDPRSKPWHTHWRKCRRCWRTSRRLTY